MNDRTSALFLIISGSIIGGAISTVTKIGLANIEPFSFAFLRFAIGSLVVIPWLLKEKAKIDKDLLKLSMISLLPAINIAFFVVGLKSTTASIGQMLYAGAPMLTAIFALLIQGERISLKKWFYILLGLSGVSIVIFLPILERGRIYAGDLRGNLLIFIGVVLWALYLVLSKPFHKKYSPQFITSIFIITTAMIFFLLQFIDFSSGKFWWEHLNPTSVIAVLYASILATVIAYTILQYAIKLGGSVIASLTNYLLPVFAYLSAFIFLGEQLTEGLVLGTILVFISIALTSYSK